MYVFSMKLQIGQSHLPKHKNKSIIHCNYQKIKTDMILNISIFYKYLVIFLTLSFVCFISISAYSSSIDNASLGVGVSTDICSLNINIAPENRWTSLSKPQYGENLSTLVKLEIIDKNKTSIGLVTNIRTDNSGYATIDTCKEKITLIQNEKFDFYIKTLSGLRKYYKDFTVELGASGKNDFTLNKTVKILNGETSIIDDDYINALDISTVISAKHYFVIDETDLNIEFEQNDMGRDRIVNALDLSNTLKNYNKEGDYCATCLLSK